MPVEPGLGAPVDPTRVPGARPTTPAQAAATPRPVPPPVEASPRGGGTRPRRRGRRVRRVVRRVELWSVLKVGIVFNTVMFGVALGAVAVLWGLANTTGLVEDFEGFLRDSGFQDFRFEGDTMFRQVAFIGGVATLAATVMLVLAAALFNLISEVTGGVRFVIIEEIVERPTHPSAVTPAASPGPGPSARPPVGPPTRQVEERLPVEPPAAARPPRAARNGRAPSRRPAPEGPASAPTR